MARRVLTHFSKSELDFFFFFFLKCLFLTWYIFRLWRDLNCFKLFLVQQRIVLVYFTSIQINQRNEKRCV